MHLVGPTIGRLSALDKRGKRMRHGDKIVMHPG
jgi:hypothetical protein